MIHYNFLPRVAIPTKTATFVAAFAIQMEHQGKATSTHLLNAQW
jgi:hypothetical protein